LCFITLSVPAFAAQNDLTVTLKGLNGKPVKVIHEESQKVSDSKLSIILSNAKEAIAEGKSKNLQSKNNIGGAATTYDYITFDDNEYYFYEESFASDPELIIYDLDQQITADRLAPFDSTIARMATQSDPIPDGVGGSLKVKNTGTTGSCLSTELTLPTSTQVSSDISDLKRPYNYVGFDYIVTDDEDHIGSWTSDIGLQLSNSVGSPSVVRENGIIFAWKPFIILKNKTGINTWQTFNSVPESVYGEGQYLNGYKPGSSPSISCWYNQDGKVRLEVSGTTVCPNRFGEQLCDTNTTTIVELLDFNISHIDNWRLVSTVVSKDNSGENRAVYSSIMVDGNPVSNDDFSTPVQDHASVTPSGNTVTIIVDFIPPTWPDGSTLTSSNVTDTSLTLTWNAATDNVGVTGYKIFKDGVEMDTVNGAVYSYDVTGLAANNQYTFKVEAGDACGNWSSDGPTVKVGDESNSMQNYIKQIAQTGGIPFEILTGIAEAESRIRPFYTGTSIPIIEPYIEDYEAGLAEEYLSTIKAVYGENWWQFIADRGLGIMQVTPKESYDECEINEQLINRLLYDTAFNIREGASILYDKWLWTWFPLNNAILPKINAPDNSPDMDPRILDNWYFAIWAYNGWDEENNPNNTDDTYQDKVFRFIESKYDIKLGKPNPEEMKKRIVIEDDNTECWAVPDGSEEFSVNNARPSRDFLTYKENEICYLHHNDPVKFRLDPIITDDNVLGLVYYNDQFKILSDETISSCGFLWQKVEHISPSNRQLKNKTGYIAIRYLTPIKDITGNTTDYSLAIGNTQNTVVTATYSNGNSYDVTEWAVYSSLNPIVASVNLNGSVKGLSVGDTVITATYGGKSAQANVHVIDNIDECFIATAAYGSKFEPAVVLLRQFRDEIMLTNSLGRTFVDFYYHYSPPLAKSIADSEPLKLIVRTLLTPIVAAVYLLFHPIWIGVIAMVIGFRWLYRRRIEMH